jgi:drug/metabolite transporter (DMT)-like permease
MKHEKAYGALTLGVVSISFAAVFIRLADGPVASVAALRLLFATIVLLPFVIFSRNTRNSIMKLPRGEKGLLVLAGLFLSLHFLSWIASLSFTGITSSIVFVTTSPIFIEIYSVTVRREKTSAKVWIGIGLTVAGAVILGGGNIAAGGENWKGDLLAVAGAIAVASYFIVGSRLRPKLTLIAYIFPVYGTAALFLVLATSLLGAGLTGLPARTYFYCFLMALVCQVTGHSLFNWALRRMKTTLVAMATLGEPIGTTMIAWLILGELPVPTEILGGVVVLAGVFVVLTGDPLRVRE